MTVDLHGAVRTAVDEARRLAQAATPGPWVREWAFSTHFVSPGPQVEGTTAAVNVARLKPQQRADADFIAAWNPRRALAMCDWADDVLRRHVRSPAAPEFCLACRRPGYMMATAWPCPDLRSAAAAFGVETGETP